MNTKLCLLVVTLLVTQITWTNNDPHDPRQQNQTGRPNQNKLHDDFYGPFPHSGNTK